MTEFTTDILSALLWVAVLAAVWAVVVYEAARFVERRNPPAGRFLEVGDLRLHYVERGSGTPVVFLHGNLTMLQDFTLTEAFADVSRGCRAIAFDRPGFGYSTRPRGRTWTPAAQADVLAEALRQLGCGPAVVVGHSWGTLAAVAMARRHPELVRSLVLLSGYYFPTPRFDVALAKIGATPILGDVLRYTITPVMTLITLPVTFRLMFSPSPITTRFHRNFPRAMLLRPWHLRATLGDGAILERSAASLLNDYAALLMPVFISAGRADRIVDATQQSLRLAREIPGAEFHDAGDTGHMVQHTASDRVSRIISRAIDAAAGAAARPPNVV